MMHGQWTFSWCANILVGGNIFRMRKHFHDARTFLVCKHFPMRKHSHDARTFLVWANISGLRKQFWFAHDAQTFLDCANIWMTRKHFYTKPNSTRPKSRCRRFANFTLFWKFVGLLTNGSLIFEEGNFSYFVLMQLWIAVYFYSQVLPTCSF